MKKLKKQKAKTSPSRTGILLLITVMSVIIGAGSLSAAASEEATLNANIADLVVYGKIFTSENNQVAEAFAVKDGKYVYVGEKEGAEAYVGENRTEVVDYTGKGLVMPSCGNGHAHYLMGHSLGLVGTKVSREDDPDRFLTQTLPDAVRQAKERGSKAVYGFGWDVNVFKANMPTRQQLDAICSDMPVYFSDEEGHKGLANTMALVNAGIMSEDGTVLKKDQDIRGGEIVMGSDGTPTGYLKEQAGTYVRSFLDNDSLLTLDRAKEAIRKTQEQMLSEGYTMYIDGWSSYFFNNAYYEAASQMDQAGDMNFVLGMSFEVESWMDVDETLAKAVDAKKYISDHVKPKLVKFFMDGTVETGTGFVDGYPDGHEGTAIWTEKEFTDIAHKVNEQGLTMHVHTMGNKAIHRAVSAFISGGKDEMRNTLVHIYNMDSSDYQLMADHNIFVTSGVLWHYSEPGGIEKQKDTVPADIVDKCYPLKSFFDYGINTSLHSDFPATSGSPDDPFGIMEIAVTGVNYLVKGEPFWPEELVTREQALTALTANCAKQMFLEAERGSIREGKYADFILVDKDVLSCPETEIHTARTEATYFEGEKVFSR